MIHWTWVTQISASNRRRSLIGTKRESMSLPLSVSRNKNLPLSSVFYSFEQLRAIFGPLFNWGEEEPYRHQERELEHTVASLSVGIKPPFVFFFTKLWLFF